jgi:hypothetical protein
MHRRGAVDGFHTLNGDDHASKEDYISVLKCTCLFTSYVLVFVSLKSCRAILMVVVLILPDVTRSLKLPPAKKMISHIPSHSHNSHPSQEFQNLDKILVK